MKYLIFIIILTGCKARPDTQVSASKVVGGAQVTAADFPAAVFIEECSATRVGGRQLLTAAHCVINDLGMRLPGFANNETTIMRFGVELRTATRFSTSIADIEIHPSYLKAKEQGLATPLEELADLAIITVKASLPAYIGTAVIDPRPLEPDDEIQYTGYGCEKTPDRVNPLSDNLLARGDPQEEQADNSQSDPYEAFRLKSKTVSVHFLHHSTYVIKNLRPSGLPDSAQDTFSGCPGDSGSGAYLPDSGGKVVVGVNSFINYLHSSITRLDDQTPHSTHAWVQKNLLR